jgi:WD40 repeat protein
VVASASADRTVKLWSARNFSCLQTFEGHAASALKVLLLEFALTYLPTDRPTDRPTHTRAASALKARQVTEA